MGGIALEDKRWSASEDRRATVDSGRHRATGFVTSGEWDRMKSTGGNRTASDCTGGLRSGGGGDRSPTAGLLECTSRHEDRSCMGGEVWRQKSC